MTPTDRTLYFARALGPFLLAVAAAITLKAGAIAPFAAAFFADAPLVFVTGALTLALGMGILAAHWRWDSAAAIIISVFGLVAALRGAALLIAPGVVVSLSEGAIQTPGIVYLPAAVAAAIGSYLCFVGWLAKRNAA